MTMRVRELWWAGLVGVILSTCGVQCPDGDSEVLIEDTEPLYFEPIASGMSTAAADTLETVVRDSLRWQSLTADLSTKQNPGVDFERMMALAVVLPAPTGGYDVQFRSVEIDGERIVAHYAVGTPADDCITAMGTTAPYAVVAVRADPRPVVFERSQELIACTFR